MVNWWWIQKSKKRNKQKDGSKLQKSIFHKSKFRVAKFVSSSPEMVLVSDGTVERVCCKDSIFL